MRRTLTFITLALAALLLAACSSLQELDRGVDTLTEGDYSLGDKVWFDEDNDGIQDAGEVGVNGVQVDLYVEAGGLPFRFEPVCDNGDFAHLCDGDPTNGEISPTLTTANDGMMDGSYLFTGLFARCYKVVFHLPAEFDGFTTQNVGDTGAPAGPNWGSEDSLSDSDAFPAAPPAVDPNLGMQGESMIYCFERPFNQGQTQYLGMDAGLVKQVVGGEGCTPGYWRQEQHFDSWVGFLPNDDFETTFGVSLDGTDGIKSNGGEGGRASNHDPATLLQAVWAQGGQHNALARHAVAALLNASNPNVSYGFSQAQVIALVQDAFASGDFESAKNALAAQNEIGCNLN